MKKLLLATTLCAAFGAAQAVPVLNYSVYDGASLNETGTSTDFRGSDLNKAISGGYFGDGTLYEGFKGGSLQIDVVPADLTFTYLGKSAGNKNSFTYDEGGSNEFSFYTSQTGTTPKTDPWAAIEVNVGVTGWLELKLKDITKSFSAFSGYEENNWNNTSFGFMDVRDIDFGEKGEFDYLILFNDRGADSDYNDMVIAVSAVQAIPEPETYALMLAGLGVVGFMARRRRQV
jgi:hypothetical protein